VFLLVLVPVVTSEEVAAEITVRADAVGRVHGIQESNRTGPILNDPVVGHPLLNLRVDGTFDRGLKGYGEFYLGETESDESLEIGELWGSTGDIYSPYKAKLGQLEVPLGTQHQYRSDHADVQSNPLIGNPLVDPTDHQLGVELRGDHDIIHWSFTLTDGTDRTSLKSDRGFGSTLNLSLRPTENIEFTFSGYRSQHGDSGIWSDTSSLSTDNLFGPDQPRKGELQQLQPERSTPYPSSQEEFGLQPDVLTIGRDLKAWQVDLSVNSWGTWRARYGELQDDLSNLDLASGGTGGMVRWNYWSLEGRVPLSVPGYLSGGWSRLNADKLRDQKPLDQGEIKRNGSLDRHRIGWGYRMTRNSLVKAEYVHGRENLTEERNDYEGLSFEVSLTGIPKLGTENLRKHSTENEKAH
jgi:hypothetical protein